MLKIFDIFTVCCSVAAGMIKHLLIIAFKSGVTEAQLSQFEADLQKVVVNDPNVISAVKGTQISPETHMNPDGMALIYDMTFTSEAARDSYLHHPDHEAFAKSDLIKEIVAKGLVFDYSPITVK